VEEDDEFSFFYGSSWWPENKREGDDWGV